MPQSIPPIRHTTDFEFPFVQALSMRPVIAWWRQVSAGADSTRAALADVLLERVKRYPELEADELDPDTVTRHADTIRGLLSAVLPVASDDRVAMAAIPPFKLEAVHATAEFERLALMENFNTRAELNGVRIPEVEMNIGRAMKAYHAIFHQFYGSGVDTISFVIGTTDAEIGLDRYMQIDIDTTFTEVRLHGDLPVLSDADRLRLISACMDLDLWTSLLPPELFSFHGFGLIRATDVTFHHVMSHIKNDLLDPDALTAPALLDRLEVWIRTLMRRPGLEIGVLTLKGDRNLEHAQPIGRSLLFGESGLPDCPHSQDSVYGRAIREEAPVIVDDLLTETQKTAYEKRLEERGMRTLVVLPLIHDHEVVGLLELASPHPGDVTGQTTFRLMEVATLLATALRRGMNEWESRVQSMIKKRYTAIHPVVEWRFRQAATRFMDGTDPAVASEAEDRALVFDDVHPLYGLADIRNSSVTRSETIRQDIVDQLGLALAAIIEASSSRAQPALDELGYRIGRYIDDLRSGQPVGEESEPLTFLQTEVEPILDRFAAGDAGVARRVTAYRDALDPNLGFIYRQRRSFDESVTMLNDAMAGYLEARDHEAQELIPHYFEKYRTDGVDYNIYVGASLLHRGVFDRLHLRDLRLWQLMTSAGLIWEVERVRPQLPLSLEVAHLILVHSNPLAIRFRRDEKRFDVDGAYNARYEIIKKRIDKARVRGRDERLTQPGHIAIVYSQPAEAVEYRRYFDYLEAAGYLEPGVEDLELEPLVGVHGLHALRVQARSEPPKLEILSELFGSTPSGRESEQV